MIEREKKKREKREKKEKRGKKREKERKKRGLHQITAQAPKVTHKLAQGSPRGASGSELRDCGASRLRIWTHTPECFENSRGRFWFNQNNFSLKKMSKNCLNQSFIYLCSYPLKTYLAPMLLPLYCTVGKYAILMASLLRCILYCITEMI